MKSTKVICISGKAQNGKDTSAGILKNILEDYGNKVLIVHYADLLKFICKTFFGWNGEKDEAGRTMLQYVGTDVIRYKSPNYWVEFVAKILSLFDSEWDYAIIPDTRFPNEIEVMKEFGFDVTHLRVARGNFESPLTKEQKEHPSETALDGYAYDYKIEADTIEDLGKRLLGFASEHIFTQVVMDEIVNT